MINIFKNAFYLMTKYMYIPEISFKEVLYRLSVAIRLQVLTLVFPLTVTFFSTILMILEGTTVDLFSFWSDYYFYGEFLGFGAWRIHLSLLFISACYCLTSDTII